MAISTTNSLSQTAGFSIGPEKMQILNFTILSGATTGTVTADALSTMSEIIIGGKLKNTAAPTFAGNVATLAFTVPTETQASLVVQDLTYTAVAQQGAGGNSITIAYTGGGTNGNEVVTVTGTAISVQIEDGVSTATHVRTAVLASAAAAALVGVAVSGTGSNAQSVATATPLAGGITGGARGSLICIGK